MSPSRLHPDASPTERQRVTTPRALSAATRLWLACLLVAVPSFGPLLAQQTAGCDGDEFRQLDFWAGDWEVRDQEGTVQGHNTIEKILGGCVLLENWTSVTGGSGKSFNMYFSADQKWHQTWVDANGGRLDLAGGLEGQRMVYRGEMPGRDGARVQHELSFEPLADGSVKQHWRASRDGGENWQDVFLGFYHRQ